MRWIGQGELSEVVIEERTRYVDREEILGNVA